MHKSYHIGCVCVWGGCERTRVCELTCEKSRSCLCDAVLGDPSSRSIQKGPILASGLFWSRERTPILSFLLAIDSVHWVWVIKSWDPCALEKLFLLHVSVSCDGFCGGSEPDCCCLRGSSCLLCLDHLGFPGHFYI